MQKLKIAIVANSCWNIFNFRKELIRHFKLAGHQVIVIAPVDEYIHYLSESYFTKHIDINHLNSLKLTPLKDVMFFCELYRIYKKEKPDLVFHFTIKPNIYGSIAAKLLGIKCISTLTGLGYSFSKLKYRIVFNSIYKWALSKNEKVAFHNSDDLSLFVNKKWIAADKGIVIPGSGVDTNAFRPQSYSYKNEKFIFLFAGRLLKDKGLEEFVAAAIEARSIIKNAEFWVIGEYNVNNTNTISKKVLLNWIESRVVKYFGHEKDVRKYLSKADVFILPSYREGMSRAILEAMSMEKPIITTEVAGCNEVVRQNWNGYLVDAKDVHQLAEAMVKIYNLSEDQRLQMGKNSRLLVLEKFDLRIILELYDNLIDEIFNSLPHTYYPGVSGKT